MDIDNMSTETIKEYIKEKEAKAKDVVENIEYEEFDGKNWINLSILNIDSCGLGETDLRFNSDSSSIKIWKSTYNNYRLVREKQK